MLLMFTWSEMFPRIFTPVQHPRHSTGCLAYHTLSSAGLSVPVDTKQVLLAVTAQEIE